MYVPKPKITLLDRAVIMPIVIAGIGEKTRPLHIIIKVDGFTLGILEKSILPTEDKAESTATSVRISILFVVFSNKIIEIITRKTVM